MSLFDQQFFTSCLLTGCFFFAACWELHRPFLLFLSVYFLDQLNLRDVLRRVPKKWLPPGSIVWWRNTASRTLRNLQWGETILSLATRWTGTEFPHQTNTHPPPSLESLISASHLSEIPSLVREKIGVGATGGTHVDECWKRLQMGTAWVTLS